MALPLVAITALATLAPPPALDEWVLLSDITYPSMDEYVETLRTYDNMTGSPVTVSSQNHARTYNSYCSGSSSSAPPWTSYFQSLFNTNTEVTLTTSGTVGAMKRGVWDFYVWNDGGEQKWFNASYNPTTHMRTRIDRHTPHIHYYEQNLVQGGGGGG